VPAAQTVPEDGTLTLSPANSNAVTVTDDGRSATLHVTLTAASGTLTLGTAAGLRFSSGDGTADPTVTFSGTLAQVNAALTNLTFIPTPQYNGAAQITVTVTDDGHSGSGSPSSGVASVPITVAPVDDAPTAVNDAYSTAAQTALTVPAPGLLANDSDPDSPRLTAAKASDPAHGTVSLVQDGSFVYIPTPGFSGTDSFTYRAGDGSGQSSPATVTIAVLPGPSVPPAPSIPPSACGPRPPVQTRPVPEGGRLSVHVEATPLNTRQNNPLQQIVFGTLQNARVTLNGQPVADGQVYTAPINTFAVDFTVERVTPGQPTLVPFTVIDGCGAWQTFVGGGAAAGF
jgi:hypothetical protein